MLNFMPCWSPRGSPGVPSPLCPSGKEDLLKGLQADLVTVLNRGSLGVMAGILLVVNFLLRISDY